MRVLVALNWEQAKAWCAEQNPPINPRDRHITIVLTEDSNSKEGLRGILLRPTDVTWVYQYYQGRYYLEVLERLEAVYRKSEGKPVGDR
jgi:hypothetical protein